MARAIWNGKVIAESQVTRLVEGNHYFPPEAIHSEYFVDSATQTRCGWKGTANYYSLQVEGKENVDAAWYYPDPLEQADSIKGAVAFWKGVSVEDTPEQQVLAIDDTGTCDL